MAARVPRVLVLQHQATCPPGWLGEGLEAAGLGLDVRGLHEGATVPAGLDGWDALVVLGGRMGAGDDDVAPWLPAVRDLIAAGVRAGAPFLGICLGHQLAAAALGGEVRPNPAGRARGLTPVGLSAAAGSDPLLGAVADGTLAVQWNKDVVVRMPPGSLVLATAPDGTVQAARFGALAWGVQFHPEASGAIFRSWTVDNPDLDTSTVGGLDLPTVAAAVDQRDGRLRRDWEPLTRRFATVVAAHAARRRDLTRQSTA